MFIEASGCNRIKTIDFETPTSRSSWGRVRTLYR